MHEYDFEDPPETVPWADYLDYHREIERKQWQVDDSYRKKWSAEREVTKWESRNADLKVKLAKYEAEEELGANKSATAMVLFVLGALIAIVSIVAVAFSYTSTFHARTDRDVVELCLDTQDPVSCLVEVQR